MSGGREKSGYGRPPKHTRFKAGQSGNPNGRPKGSKNFRTELSEELSETMAIRENGIEIRVTKQRAIIKLLLSNALDGDPKILNVLVSLISRDVADGRPDEPPSQAEQAILDDYIEKEVARRLEQRSRSTQSK